MGKKVESLQKFAVKAAHQEIVSILENIFLYEEELNRCDEDDESAEKREKVAEILAEASKNIRDKLSDNLMGFYSRVRHQLVKRYVSSYINHYKYEEVNYNLCLTFFKCLLDESFKSFDLTGGDNKHPFHFIEPVELLDVIINLSPHLQTLKLCFGLPFVPSLGEMLLKFECLTSLSLSWYTGIMAGDTFMSFFSALGDLHLINLDLGGDFPFYGTDQLTALMFGKKRELLPQHLLSQMTIDSSFLAHLQFSEQSLTPICSSLVLFKVESWKVNIRMRTATVAFILRHFHRLRNCDLSEMYNGSSYPSQAIYLLHRQQLNAIHPITSQSSSVALGTVQWTADAPFHSNLPYFSLLTVYILKLIFNNLFTDSLNLLSLKLIKNGKSRKLMQAVASLCTGLREIHLVYHVATELKSFLQSVQSTEFCSKVFNFRFCVLFDYTILIHSKHYCIIYSIVGEHYF